jgi:hypothetical protein
LHDRLVIEYLEGTGVKGTQGAIRPHAQNDAADRYQDSDTPDHEEGNVTY